MLLASPGDPQKGFNIAANRQLGACTLCHAGPFPLEKVKADIAPPLDGVASRKTTEELRLQLVAPTEFNPDSLMPSYRRVDGLVRVEAARAGRPMLTDQEIEDVVAWLSTLKD